MTVFNSWYYSFSPFIANMIGQNLVAMESTRAAIYPLVWTLSISEKLQSGLGHEAGIMVGGAFAAFTIGLIYFGPLAGLICALFPRSRGARSTMICISLPVLSALLLAALIGGGWLLSAGAAALVLTSIASGAAVGSTMLTASSRKLVEGLN